MEKEGVCALGNEEVAPRVGAGNDSQRTSSQLAPDLPAGQNGAEKNVQGLLSGRRLGGGQAAFHPVYLLVRL